MDTLNSRGPGGIRTITWYAAFFSGHCRINSRSFSPQAGEITSSASMLGRPPARFLADLFRRPPSEPDVTVSDHPALQYLVTSVSCLISALLGGSPDGTEGTRPGFCDGVLPSGLPTGESLH